MNRASGADLHGWRPDPAKFLHHAMNGGFVDPGARVADAALARAGALARRSTIDHVVDVLVGKTGGDRYRADDAVTGLAAVPGGRAAAVMESKITRSRHAGNGGTRLGAGAGCGFALGVVSFGRAFGFAAALFGGAADGFDLETLVHVEALFAVEALHEFARGFADSAGDARGIDLDGAAVGALLTVFVAECDVVSIHFLFR